MTELAFNEFANATETEWVESPVFDNAAEGLAYMDEQERAAIAEMEAEARARMAADAEDPRTQHYFMRMDRKTVIKDDKEFVRCQVNNVGIKVIPYGHALQLLKEEDAAKRQSLKDKKKKKAAKASKKRNRRQ